MKIKEAIARHVAWKLTFQMHITLRETLPADLMEKIHRPDLCLVGVWIASPDTLKVRGTKEFTDLNREHLRFHGEMVKVAELINEARFEQAEAMLSTGSKFRGAAHDLANAITALGRLVA